MIGPTDLVMVALVALVFVGPKRLPEAGQRLGRALREFQTMTAEIRSQTGLDEIANSVNDIKSVLSLTGADRPPTIDAVASVPASSIPCHDRRSSRSPRHGDHRAARGVNRRRTLRGRSCRSEPGRRPIGP